MSFLVVFSLAILAFSTSALEKMPHADIKTLMNSFRAQCLEVSELNPADTVSLLDKTKWSSLTIPQLCYMKCISEQLEVMDKDGNIQMENFKNFQISMGEEVKGDDLKCVEEAGSIKTCKDMMPLLQCAFRFI